MTLSIIRFRLENLRLLTFVGRARIFHSYSRPCVCIIYRAFLVVSFSKRLVRDLCEILFFFFGIGLKIVSGMNATDEYSLYSCFERVDLFSILHAFSASPPRARACK